MDGYISDLRFNPSQEVYDKDHNRLFGFIVRQQGPKLVMIIDVYNESKREEIIGKTKIMAAMAEKITDRYGIYRVCIVDKKDVNDQLSKYNIDHKKFDMEREQDVTVEVEDLVRGGFVPVIFSMGITKIKGIVKDGKRRR